MQLKDYLEELYSIYNKRQFVHPDPLEFLYGYPDPSDREIVGLIASSLAYGRVTQILKSVKLVLSHLPEPKKDLLKMDYEAIKQRFKDFKHRFTTGEDLTNLLWGIRKVVDEYQSLGEAFRSLYNPNDTTFVLAVARFVQLIREKGGFDANFLLPSPENGSACKRLFLFLRWMVRCDEVDPGGWQLPTSKLIVPLDTHMFQIAKRLGFTCRKQADIKTAMEITEAFKKISPDDPVRYDFCLTRFGIHPDMDYSMLKCPI